MQQLLSLQTLHQLQLELTLDLCGGATESVFPKAERLLQCYGVQDALAEIVPVEVQLPYRSIMDMLSVETFPRLCVPCAAFYAGEGPPLRETATPGEIAMYERGIIMVMRAARRSLRKKMEDRWHYALCAIF